MNSVPTVRSLRAAAAALLIAIATSPVLAQQGGSTVGRIAAVVNEDIISVTDLNERMELALLSTGLPDTQESRDRLRPQVLRGLVDEALQLQEAKRNSITVTDQEMKEALGHIAEQNRMPPAQMEKMLRDHHVPISTLKDQVRAGIAWKRLIQRRLQPSVTIGDDEIEAAVERIQANAGKPEFLVAEIFLSVDRPGQEAEVSRLADRLVDQIRKGTSFSAVARQFSQAAGAANGGDLGWIQQGQLPEDLDKALRQMRPGQISPPIRSASGYHILLVREVRTVSGGNPADTKVHLQQVAFPVAGESSRNAVALRAKQFADSVNGCPAFEARVKSLGLPASGDVGEVRIGDMPPQLQQLVAGLPIGRASPPLSAANQVVVLMVCDRHMPSSSAPPREAIANALGNERLDMLQRRYMRDLRRSAFVELRV
ncbi:MAG: peptidylprolyl isomerase [Azospirillum sp.]|nr:peptidylprolyl isomerase [Azospirillum sp.]